MFHWKGGATGAALTAAGFVLNHVDAFGSLGKYGGLVVLAAGVAKTMLSEKVGAPKSNDPTPVA